MSDQPDDDITEIRTRWEAVEDLDWSLVRQRGVERYGDWVDIGMLSILDITDDARYLSTLHSDDLAFIGERDAMIEFQTHVVEDMRTLLARRAQSDISTGTRAQLAQWLPSFLGVLDEAIAQGRGLELLASNLAAAMQHLDTQDRRCEILASEAILRGADPSPELHVAPHRAPE